MAFTWVLYGYLLYIGMVHSLTIGKAMPDYSALYSKHFLVYFTVLSRDKHLMSCDPNQIIWQRIRVIFHV